MADAQRRLQSIAVLVFACCLVGIPFAARGAETRCASPESGGYYKRGDWFGSELSASACSRLDPAGETLYQLHGDSRARVYLFGHPLDAAEVSGRVAVDRTEVAGETRLRFLGNTLLHIRARQPLALHDTTDDTLVPPTTQALRQGADLLLTAAADGFRRTPAAWAAFRAERGCPPGDAYSAEALLSGLLVKTGVSSGCALFTGRADALAALDDPGHPSRKLADAVAQAEGRGLTGTEVLGAVLDTIESLGGSAAGAPADISLHAEAVPIIKETPASKMTVMLGPIPVEIESGANGQLSAGWRMDLAPHRDTVTLANGLQVARLIPYDSTSGGYALSADFGAYTRAGVNLIIVQVGVDGRLQLAREQIDAAVAASLFAQQAVTGQVERISTGPSGRLSAFAKWSEPVLYWRRHCWRVCFWGCWKVCVHLPALRWDERRAETTLADFPGHESRERLLSF